MFILLDKLFYSYTFSFNYALNKYIIHTAITYHIMLNYTRNISKYVSIKVYFHIYSIVLVSTFFKIF